MMNDKDSDPNISFDELSISINQRDPLLLPVSLKQKQILYCDGKTIKLYNSQWQLLQTIDKPLPLLAKGMNELKFDGKYSGENGGKIKIEVRTKGIPETLK
ncbi:MAG: hypothetical protein E6H08_16220 [Bacteroidetes bacterium]|nr:MAG: hypothetical protein E6H08_16220 [Bacteroidota bacterium]